ncbi:hypothetical protein FRC01_014225 [Tulasnella sp. 417]|nr:hypothetical protein FRC01_014225 [Tulasnella sp. 417]
MDETLEWIFSHLDPHQQALPASLSFYGSTADPKWLTWLSSTLKVTKLQLQTYSDHDRILDIISLLSQPLVSTPTQWPLPDLKSIETNVVSQYGKSKILEMVKARACFIQAQGKPEGGDIALQPFKEIRLRGGMRDVYGPYSRHVDLLNELQEAARGAEIWWDDFKWTGSENSARQ